MELDKTEVHAIEPLGHRWTSKDRAALEGIREAVALGGRPLCLRVPTPVNRIRARGITSVVCSVPLPEGSFEVLSVAEGTDALGVPPEAELLVDSASLAFVEAARQFTRLVSRGKLSWEEASIRLLALGAEDCGSYVLDPWRPREGGCLFEVAPVMSTTVLGTYLCAAKGLDGLAMARGVADLIPDGCASPMETLVYAGLTLPPDLGGFGLVRPEANARIDLSPMQQLMLNHVDHITPDLLWRDWCLIIEYLGHEPHSGAEALDEDSGRVQDYQVLGYAVLPLTFKHVRNPTEFNRTVLRFARIMESRGLQGVVAQVQALLSNQEFLGQQRVLFQVLLPSVDR